MNRFYTLQSTKNKIKEKKQKYDSESSSVVVSRSSEAITKNDSDISAKTTENLVPGNNIRFSTESSLSSFSTPSTPFQSTERRNHVAKHNKKEVKNNSVMLVSAVAHGQVTISQSQPKKSKSNNRFNNDDRLFNTPVYSTSIPLQLLPPPITVFENKGHFDENLSILTDDSLNYSNHSNDPSYSLSSNSQFVNENSAELTEDQIKLFNLFAGSKFQKTSCGKLLTQVPNHPYLYFDASHPEIQKLLKEFEMNLYD